MFPRPAGIAIVNCVGKKIKVSTLTDVSDGFKFPLSLPRYTLSWRLYGSHIRSGYVPEENQNPAAHFVSLHITELTMSFG
jgi:hypothetical protein